MGSATAASVYGRRFPVTARSHDDPRKLRWGMVDGRSQAQQQLKMAELEEEGRRRSRLPKEEEEKEEEDKPLFGFHFAIAHYDALRAAKKPAVAEAEKVKSPAEPLEESEVSPESAGEAAEAEGIDETLHGIAPDAEESEVSPESAGEAAEAEGIDETLHGIAPDAEESEVSPESAGEAAEAEGIDETLHGIAPDAEESEDFAESAESGEIAAPAAPVFEEPFETFQGEPQPPQVLNMV